jgi:hypothetical protein
MAHRKKVRPLVHIGVQVGPLGHIEQAEPLVHDAKRRCTSAGFRARQAVGSNPSFGPARPPIL